MRDTFLLIISLFSVQYFQAQTNSITAFDSIYYKTAIETSRENSDHALVIADSLCQFSKSNLLKMRALMLSAAIHQIKNNPITSIKYARQAYEHALREGNYSWQARICGFLSTQYRSIGLREEGLEYVKQALRASSRVSNSSEKKMQMALIEQELAHYALLEQEFETVLHHISNSNKYFGEIVDSENSLYHQVSGEDLRGRAYFGLGVYDEAENVYLKGLTLLNSLDQEDKVLGGYIYMGLGAVAAKKEKDSLALSYFDLAEKRAKETEHLRLELALYKQIADLYKRNENWELFKVYSDRLDSLNSVERNLRRSAVQSVFAINKEAKNKSERLAKVYLGVGLVLVSLLIFYIFYCTNRKRKAYKKFQFIIADLKKEKKDIETQNVQDTENYNFKKRILSEEAELKILEHLKRFEESLEFLQPTTSLSSVAAFCDTNTKYLSYVLNQNIGKDFSSYINELRINYGVAKLENCPEFRSYKISYLAEYLGFSSHSKFTAVFKEITDIAPSTFIEYLKKEKGE